MNHFLILMLCCLFLVGCLNEEQKKEIDKEVILLIELKAQIEGAYDKFETGELTAAQVKDIVVITRERIVSVQEKIEVLQDQGIGGWEMALYGVLSVLGLRGWPSKGPLAILGRLAGNLFTKRADPPKIGPA